MRKVILAWCFLAGLGLASMAKAGWQDTPDALGLAPMGDSLRMNGTPMVIRSFTSDMELDEVLRAVLSSWERPGAAPVQRNTLPTWIVLNQTVGDQHRSLQIRQKGAQVEGFVALTSPKLTRRPALTVRLPALVTALQVVDSVDAGKTSQQVMAVSRRSKDVTASAFEDSLKTEGWTRQLLKKNGDQVMLSANRGDEKFDALITQTRAGAVIMMNTIK